MSYFCWKYPLEIRSKWNKIKIRIMGSALKPLWHKGSLLILFVASKKITVNMSYSWTGCGECQRFFFLQLKPNRFTSRKSKGHAVNDLFRFPRSSALFLPKTTNLFTVQSVKHTYASQTHIFSAATAELTHEKCRRAESAVSGRRKSVFSPCRSASLIRQPV